MQENVNKILQLRYYDKTSGESSWEAICNRVAKYIASAESEHQEEWANRFFDLIYDRYFSPNTPTWINAGVDGKGSLSACFVLPLEDNMESILECSRLFGMVQKHGGGTGVSLSKLRAKGAPIKTTHGKACGPIAVLRYLAATSQMITQGGARQGANMAVLDVYHPDIMEFINIKSQENKYLLQEAKQHAENMVQQGKWDTEEAQEYIEYCRNTGVFQLFNVSVAVDDEFMEGVKQYYLIKRDNIENNFEWNKVLPCGENISTVWDAIVNMAWSSGDPGILFIDRARAINKYHTIYELNATNPCGEQYLPDYSSCNLGSIDLGKFVEDGEINYARLHDVIYESVRFLDNVVEINKHADPEIDRVNREERRIGLGIMGWADMLLKLKIPYDSQEAIDILNAVGMYFRDMAHEASVQLAKEKGPFKFWKQVQVDEEIIPKFRRNATVTTIAPTGTISLLAGCSGGIEPHFSAGYEHQGMREHGGLGYIFASEVIMGIAQADPYLMSLLEAGEYYEFTQKIEERLRTEFNWKPANEIDVNWHIKHQGSWQQYIDNSISKTINLKNSATERDVESAYIQAWELGCKGCTIYRDGCKPEQVLNIVKETVTTSEPEIVPIPEDNSDGVVRIVKRKPRPRIVPGQTYRVETAEGDVYITINYDEREMPYELFIRAGQVGTNTTGYLDAIAKLISEMLRSGIHPYRIVKQLRGIKTNPYGLGLARILSTPDAIGKTIEEYMTNTFSEEWAIEFGWNGTVINGHGSYDSKAELFQDTKLCPNCGNEIVVVGGCDTCYTCGYSKCQ